MMITITNPKVAGFVPQWAPFRGFSVLFDNSDASLVGAGSLKQLAGDVDNDPALGFYRALRDAITGLDLRVLRHTYLFCPLPSLSYHVTVWDGANDGSLNSGTPSQRQVFEHLIADLPQAFSQPHPLIQLVAESELVRRKDWNIQFCFNRLQLIGHTVLLAELAPADSEAELRMQELVSARRALSVATQASYGISPYERFWPHVSLGYFANHELAQLAMPCVPLWDALFRERLANQRLTFSSASIYGFSDMATFFRAG
jgi:hypothetical protein